MRERIGFSARLEAGSNTFLRNTRRKLSPSYAAAEVVWYLAGGNTLDIIVSYAPSYARFAEPDGHVWGAYGRRIFSLPLPQGRSPMGCVLNELNKSYNSRQAVLPIFQPADLWALSFRPNKPRDIPCTLSLQFLMRDGFLHMITTMRSNDLWLGLPYDIFAFTCLQNIVAGEMGVKPGDYIHNVGSLHLYEKDRSKAVEAIAVHQHNTEGHRWEIVDRLDSIPYLVDNENVYRTGEGIDNMKPLGDMGKDLCYCLASKWMNVESCRFTSSSLADGVFNHADYRGS